MKFDDSDRADVSQVEDRRGIRYIGAGVGGLGLVGAIILGLFRLLTGDDKVGAEERPEPVRHGPQGPTAIAPGSCRGVTSATDHAKFIVCVATNVQSFWEKELARKGANYRPGKLVLFTERTATGCGVGSASTGPFYCPTDEKVYLDLGFFQALLRRLGAHGGDFAEAYVVAHEYGHHVQDVLGISRKAHAEQVRDPEERNAVSVRLELQADCFAGVWGHSAYEKGKVGSDEIAHALDAAAAVGDDRIQERVRGRVSPETFTHGSSAMRQRWFKRGLESGDTNACDTFAER